jgi:hypothetical protein
VGQTRRSSASTPIAGYRIVVAMRTRPKISQRQLPGKVAKKPVQPPSDSGATAF